jgi:hypothetical protein
MGKGKKACGGILLRGLMKVEAQVGKDGKYEIKSGSDQFKANYTDGPCNSVNKIL